MGEQYKGKVKWFSDEKGYGFIERADGKKDLFVHHTSIQMSGRRTLKDGEAVEFEVEETPKGQQAMAVRRLGV